MKDINYYRWFENYQGGINNLTVVEYNGVRASSLKGETQAVNNLKRKLKKNNINL